VKAVHTRCRIFGHSWSFTTVAEEGRFYVQGLRCDRCTTVKHMKIHKVTGEVSGYGYHYVRGYLIPGGFTRDERNALRLTEVKRHLR
jgi:hypothetical protein